MKIIYVIDLINTIKEMDINDSITLRVIKNKNNFILEIKNTNESLVKIFLTSDELINFIFEYKKNFTDYKVKSLAK